jgi:O-antigen/teichoic acid export membrane protein
MIFHVATGSCGTILMMSGHPEFSAINEAIMLVTVVGLNLLLIPRYGLLGAVWAVAAGLVAVNTLRVIQVWWYLRIHPYSLGLLKVATAGVTMCAILWGWRVYGLHESTTWYLLLLGAGLALLVYGIVLIVLGLEKEEVEALQALRQRLRRILV